jgi:hypothetical protein
MKYVLLVVISFGMLLFSLGAVYLSTEEKDQRNRM